MPEKALSKPIPLEGSLMFGLQMHPVKKTIGHEDKTVAEKTTSSLSAKKKVPPALAPKPKVIPKRLPPSSLPTDMPKSPPPLLHRKNRVVVEDTYLCPNVSDENLPKELCESNPHDYATISVSTFELAGFKADDQILQSKEDMKILLQYYMKTDIKSLTVCPEQGRAYVTIVGAKGISVIWNTYNQHMYL